MTSPFLTGGAAYLPSARTGWHASYAPPAPAPPMPLESFDPALVANGQVLTAGWLWTVRCTLGRPTVLSRLWCLVNTAGVTLTSNQNFLALFDAAGARVGLTASLHTAFASAAVVSASMTAPYAAAPGDYYIGVLANGGTGPSLLAGTALGVTGFGTAGNVGNRLRRFGLAGTGLTAMPASITPGSIDGSISSTIWLGAD